jgi:uncharacterized protein (TIGR03435 family)
MKMLCVAVAFVAAILLVNGRSAQAQAPAPPPATLKFEVASVKPSQPGVNAGGIRPAPGGERYVATNLTLKQLIAVAYRISGDRVAGPEWIDNNHYDMNAKAERSSTLEELHIMLQSLLTERFKLQLHHENKELPVYALVVDKGGIKIQPHNGKSAGDPWIEPVWNFPQVTMHARFAPMDFFAWRLSQNLDRPLVDETQLTGGYDFDLAFTKELPPDLPPDATFNGMPIDRSGPTIFDAVRQQLGLKLESRKDWWIPS